MVCPRCITAVTDLLEAVELKPKSVLLGEVELYTKPNDEAIQLFSQALLKKGFQLLTTPEQELINKVKTLIIKKVQKCSIEAHFSIGTYLKSNTLRDYSTLTKLFSAVEGCTIEKYFILQKVEKVKELLLYRQLTIKEIATRLGYSSCQHLSAQFKKFTKLTPTEFKDVGAKARKPIDNVLYNAGS